MESRQNTIGLVFSASSNMILFASAFFSTVANQFLFSYPANIFFLIGGAVQCLFGLLGYVKRVRETPNSIFIFISILLLCWSIGASIPLLYGQFPAVANLSAYLVALCLIGASGALGITGGSMGMLFAIKTRLEDRSRTVLELNTHSDTSSI